MARIIIKLLLLLTVTQANGQRVLFHNNNWVAASGYDVDAEAFFLAAGITDVTEKSATSQLVTDLKAASIWTKFQAIYPMVGGTAVTHKWNLKDPRDLNAAFRLTFSGTWTHSSTGALPNGTTGYASTFYIPSVNGTASSLALNYYSRTNQTACDCVEIGSYDAGSPFFPDMMYVKYIGNVMYGTIDNAGAPSGTVTDSRGFFTASRISTTSCSIYKNGSSVGITTASQVSRPSNLQITLGALNQNSVIQAFSAKECAFASIGTGLTGAEVTALYTAVQAFETTLSRQL